MFLQPQTSGEIIHIFEEQSPVDNSFNKEFQTVVSHIPLNKQIRNFKTEIVHLNIPVSSMSKQDLTPTAEIMKGLGYQMIRLQNMK